MSNNHNHKNEDFSSLKNDLKGVPHEIELVHHKNHTHDSKNSNKLINIKYNFQKRDRMSGTTMRGLTTFITDIRHCKNKE